MGNKLLLADDSITIQKVVGIIFANEDYDLTVVDNGIAALDKARELVPDIILIDALMPGKNGYEVCEAVRREPALSHIPLLLLTGAFEPFDEERARQCGADDSISKPFESQHLIDKVRALIAQGKERAEARPEQAPTAPALQWEETPGASPPEVSPAPPSIALPVIEAGAGEGAGDFFTAVEEGGEDIFATDLTAAEEVVEVSPDEDLWGAFDVEEASGDDAFAFEGTAETTLVETAAGLTPEEEFFFAEEELGPVSAGAEPFAAPQEFISAVEPAAEDIFTFADEPGPAVAGAEPYSAPQEFIPPEEPAAEDFFSFAEESPATAFDSVAGADTFGDIAVDMVPGIETTEEFLAAAAMPQPAAEERAAVQPQVVEAAPEVERQFAPEEEYVPVLDAPSAPAAVAAPSSVTGEVTLSDEQLAVLVSRISRDILEKIAWEVVPDLAETIIREEIRKIKEGQ